MIKVSIKLDKRRKLKNGKFPLKFKIARKNTAFYIPTGYELEEKEWDNKSEKIKNVSDKKILNLKLQKRLFQFCETIQDLQLSGKLRMISNKRLYNILIDGGKDMENTNFLFKTQYENFMLTKDSKTTIGIYDQAIKKIKKFYQYDDLNINDIDVDWLEDFERNLKKDGNDTNTIAIRLVCIRAILNHAKRKGIIEKTPFENFKIKKEETRKRSLSVEALRKLYFLKLPENLSLYRDIFFLSFFLMGINYVDLAQITEIVDGRISYRRAKTGTLYNIKVEPEALELINRYKGSKHFFSFFDKQENYRHLNIITNMKLKIICSENQLPNISMYWARHSFATVAYEIGIPIDTIADCLGHKNGHEVTQIYIKKDINKIDEANRKVIDFVLYNKI